MAQAPPQPSLEQRITYLERLLQVRAEPTRSDGLRAAGDFEETAPAWVPEHDYSPEEDRSVIRALRGNPGVTSWDDFIVTATSPPSWNVNVGPGRAVIDGSTTPWLQGSYVVYSPESALVPITPAHPTQDRYDVVGIHVLDQQNSTEEGFGWRREVITGTPGAGDGPPELPPNFLPLQGLRITAGDSSVTQASGFPPVWPQGVNSYGDLRRPVTSPLYQQVDLKRRDVAVNTTQSVAWFSWTGGVPASWIPLVLWPFPVVMHVMVSVTAWMPTTGTVAGWRFYPRNMAAQGGQFHFQETRGYGGNVGASWCFQEYQLFDPAQSQAPTWELTCQAGTGSVSPAAQITTTIYPYTTNMRRLTHLDNPALHNNGQGAFPALNFP